MTWVTPKTNWQPDEVVTADDMNDIGGDLDALKHPPTDISNVDHATNFNTTSSTFTDVDPDTDIATNQLGVQVTTNGGPLLVTFSGSVGNSSANPAGVYFDLTLDGTRVAGNDGIILVTVQSGGAANASFTYWLDDVAAGTHTIRLQWRTNNGTATLWAGAGTSGADMHPQFAVREVS
jgi:hypothetical protein